VLNSEYNGMKKEERTASGRTCFPWKIELFSHDWFFIFILLLFYMPTCSQSQFTVTRLAVP